MSREYRESNVNSRLASLLRLYRKSSRPDMRSHDFHLTRIAFLPVLGMSNASRDDMPRGEKSAYTDQQERQAEHIEESEMEEGRSREDAERIAWATVNKQDGGGRKFGSGRKTAKRASSGTTAAKKSA